MMIIYQETPLTLFWQQFHFSFGGVILCFGFYTIPMVCFKKRDKLSIWKCVRFQCENENTKIFFCEMHSENISTTGLCVSKLSRDRAMIFYLLDFLNHQQFQICIEASSIVVVVFFFCQIHFQRRMPYHTFDMTNIFCTLQYCQHHKQTQSKIFKRFWIESPKKRIDSDLYYVKITSSIVFMSIILFAIFTACISKSIYSYRVYENGNAK